MVKNKGYVIPTSSAQPALPEMVSMSALVTVDGTSQWLQPRSSSFAQSDGHAVAGVAIATPSKWRLSSF